MTPDLLWCSDHHIYWDEQPTQSASKTHTLASRRCDIHLNDQQVDVTIWTWIAPRVRAE